jgi:GNAT superfamily N-acetyltransferase
VTLFLFDRSSLLLLMDSLRIRPAAPGDAAPLGRLLEQLGYPTDAADIPGRIERLHARPGTMVLVAEDEHGDVVGVVTVHLFQSIHSAEPAAWLTSLVVEEKARGQGVGSALVLRAEEWAIQHGALRLSLTSALHREQAHEFYKTRDYEHTGVRLTKVFVNRLGDAPPGHSRSSRKGGAKNPRNPSRR